MDSKSSEFYPFYDPQKAWGTLGYPAKIGIALGVGAFYVLLQYYTLPDKTVFFQQYCWILGAIISTSILALYIATDVFRSNLEIMNALDGNDKASSQVISDWLSDKSYLLAGLGFATLNMTVSHLLGVPADFHATPFSLVMIYVGVFLSGFTCGMGLLGIVGVITLHLKISPDLQHSLIASNPDGTGGIKSLGDSLWFFGLLVGAVGVLVTIYMFGVQWAYIFRGYVQVIFLCWVALPYVVAFSIVLIPGLAVRRQANSYKSHTTRQLREGKARLYTSSKNFDEKADDDIILEKKELTDRLNKIRDQIENLKKMR